MFEALEALTLGSFEADVLAGTILGTIVYFLAVEKWRGWW